MEEFLGGSMKYDILEGSELSRADKPIAWDLETYKWEERPLIIEKLIDKKIKRLVRADAIEKNKQEVLDELALSPLTGQIILSGFYDGKEYTVLTGSEKDIITSTISLITEKLLDGYVLVTKGGKRFDIPYLIIRAMLYNLKPKFHHTLKHLVYKYDNHYHADLETILDGYSLSMLGHLFEFTDSPHNDGEKIGQWYEEGKMKEIVEKNQEDLRMTLQIYERIKWLNP